MRIGGFVPCSLSDFPGRVAAVVFTQGCNWRCPWCHNPTLVYPESFAQPLDDEAVMARLAVRRGRLDGVVITGGEPTLQSDLAAFLVRAKALGLETKLDTNGSRPQIVRTLLERGLVDYVAMDIKAPWPGYEAAVGVPVDVDALRETIALVRASGVEHQFRTTRWRQFGPEEAREIEEAARGSEHVWQEYRRSEPVGTPASAESG